MVDSVLETGPLPDGDADDGVIGILRHHEV
jgi:hypothetical protein